MDKIIQTCVLIFFAVCSVGWSLPVKNQIPSQNLVEIQQIDQDIEELQEIKRGYEGKALRHEDYAQRLQFNNEAHLEARRHMQLAKENREKAAIVQKEIDRLEAKKNSLMKADATSHL